MCVAPVTRYQQEEKMGGVMTTTVYLVKKIGVKSVAMFGAIIGMICGTFLGIVLAMNVGPDVARTGGSLLLGMGSGFMTFALNVILGIISGFIGGAIVAFIYNSDHFPIGDLGGIELNLETRP